MTVLEFIFELDGSTAWVTIEILAVRIPLHVSVRHRSKPDTVSYLAGSALKEGILRHHRALFHFGFKLGHQALLMEHVEAIALWQEDTGMVIQILLNLRVLLLVFD